MRMIKRNKQQSSESSYLRVLAEQARNRRASATSKK
ncbi:hypothetical protein HNR30_002569 [Nonomuraea soli]|uniref:Uncharacterized protein n=1 Tax=Nonomuraea soli TaxID=1032476 RepID=A0A7W0CHH3_9ACTN|nr:hypothetical protein [Nonomuraea soli]